VRSAGEHSGTLAIKSGRARFARKRKELFVCGKHIGSEGMVLKWLAGFLGYRPVSQFSTKLNCVSLRTLRDIYSLTEIAG
jgi:hypothetical protein